MIKCPIRNIRRAILMYRLRKRNHTLAAIGKRYGVSKERVRQILFVYECRYIPGTDILRDPPKDVDHLIMPKKHSDAAKLWAEGLKYTKKNLTISDFARALGIPPRLIKGKLSPSASSISLKFWEKRYEKNRKHGEKVLNKILKRIIK